MSSQEEKENIKKIVINTLEEIEMTRAEQIMKFHCRIGHRKFGQMGVIFHSQFAVSYAHSRTRKFEKGGETEIYEVDSIGYGGGNSYNAEVVYVNEPSDFIIFKLKEEKKEFKYVPVVRRMISGEQYAYVTINPHSEEKEVVHGFGVIKSIYNKEGDPNNDYFRGACFEGGMHGNSGCGVFSCNKMRLLGIILAREKHYKEDKQKSVVTNEPADEVEPAIKKAKYERMYSYEQIILSLNTLFLLLIGHGILPEDLISKPKPEFEVDPED